MMGAFKERMVDFQSDELDTSPERLEFEMEVLSEALVVFERRCEEIESAVNLVLQPRFRSRYGFMKSQFILRSTVSADTGPGSPPNTDRCDISLQM